MTKNTQIYMKKLINPAEWLLKKNESVLLDVRSPGEYEIGHIPNAVSFPLFSDIERAKVGTCYKQQNKELAFQMGLKFVGPKMAKFVQSAIRLAPEKKITVHCWRGGQRSQSMAWLLGAAGFQVEVLEGGYKSYRTHILEYFEKSEFKIIILGGSTGSGKTKLLHILRDMGEQIIDLEGLANHKGSAFGFIGEQPQPRVEHFENLLFEALQGIDPTKIVWVENESRNIGRCYIPAGFWEKKKNAPLFNIEIPLEKRLENLIEDYAKYPASELVEGFRRIDKKLGGLNFKNAIEALDNGDYSLAARIALQYYDKTYQHCLNENVSPKITNIIFKEESKEEIVRKLIAMSKF
jgi:tRNA 2-selenouridine synthase